MSQSISLAGKTALVTGAATGIGKAIAGALAAAGGRVVGNHPHTPEPAAAVVAAIAAAGGTALAIAADVSSRAEYQAMVARLLGEYGRWAHIGQVSPGTVLTPRSVHRSWCRAAELIALVRVGICHGRRVELGPDRIGPGPPWIRVDLVERLFDTVRLNIGSSACLAPNGHGVKG
jgi:NAD(P)-dependent dehydrogenase (short-subunit alcohol dehydrogenase family)